MPANLRDKIQELLRLYPPEAITKELKEISGKRAGRSLTVVANGGIHPIPEEYLRGEVFYFSEGTLELNREFVENTLSSLTKNLSGILNKIRWNEIFLVPTGHPLLSLVATLVIFRVTRIEPTIVSYFGAEGYRDIRLDTRKWLTSTKFI